MSRGLLIVDVWGLGCYEDTARELEPVAALAVGMLELQGGERVLDLACGTGNAALAAVAAGALVTGLDISPRLLSVARDRVPCAKFVQADAADLPFDDGGFDALVSVFGVNFAHPAEAVADEIARVLRPGGVAVLTAWNPIGPIAEAGRLMRQTLADSGASDGAPLVDWGDRRELDRLLGAQGDVEIIDRELRYEVTTPEDVWSRWEKFHPMWIRARGLLENGDDWDKLSKACLAVLRKARLGAGATSPYRAVRFRRYESPHASSDLWD